MSICVMGDDTNTSCCAANPQETANQTGIFIQTFCSIHGKTFDIFAAIHFSDVTFLSWIADACLLVFAHTHGQRVGGRGRVGECRRQNCISESLLGPMASTGRHLLKFQRSEAHSRTAAVAQQLADQLPTHENTLAGACTHAWKHLLVYLCSDFGKPAVLFWSFLLVRINK